MGIQRLYTYEVICDSCLEKKQTFQSYIESCTDFHDIRKTINEETCFHGIAYINDSEYVKCLCDDCYTNVFNPIKTNHNIKDFEDHKFIPIWYYLNSNDIFYGWIIDNYDGRLYIYIPLSGKIVSASRFKGSHERYDLIEYEGIFTTIEDIKNFINDIKN